MSELYCTVSPLHPAGYEPCPVCKELETLRARVSELEMEINGTSSFDPGLKNYLYMYYKRVEELEGENRELDALRNAHLDERFRLEAELTASRANEARLREALMSFPNVFTPDGYYDECEKRRAEALSSTHSTDEWLEDIRREAKREERRRCATEVWGVANDTSDETEWLVKLCEERIRALGDE